MLPGAKYPIKVPSSAYTGNVFDGELVDELTVLLSWDMEFPVLYWIDCHMYCNVFIFTTNYNIVMSCVVY